jgi:hypothetical protein
MKYRALRGVCIGPGRHLLPGDAPAELDDATARFLVSIGAVEPAAEPQNDQLPTTAPAKPGKKES